MQGDDRKRFCEGCGKHVHNFAAMRDAEIAELLDGRPICAQLYRRTDGTILTADCSVGVRLARTSAGRLVLRVAAASITLLATAAGALGSRSMSERISNSNVNVRLGRVQAPPVPGQLEAMMGDVAAPASQPATQPTRGELVPVQRPTVGIIALPATQPTTQATNE